MISFLLLLSVAIILGFYIYRTSSDEKLQERVRKIAEENDYKPYEVAIEKYVATPLKAFIADVMTEIEKKKEEKKAKSED